MVLQSWYQSLEIVVSHLFGQEVDLQLLGLGMLPLEIFYIPLVIYTFCELM